MGESARATGFRMMDFIQENPSLVAAMGLGAVWLIQQRNKSDISGDRMARFAYTGPIRSGFYFTITTKLANIFNLFGTSHQGIETK